MRQEKGLGAQPTTFLVGKVTRSCIGRGVTYICSALETLLQCDEETKKEERSEEKKHADRQKKSCLGSLEAEGQLAHRCSAPVTLRGLMRNDVLLLNGGGGQVHGRRWYQQCMEKAAWRTSVDSVL